jgi:hypothetical protein
MYCRLFGLRMEHKGGFVALLHPAAVCGPNDPLEGTAFEASRKYGRAKQLDDEDELSSESVFC